MREIKFRGLTIDDNKMVYGDLLLYRVYPVIFDKNKKQHEVKATTVGQFTGLLDKNGREIYEGDIIELKGYWKREVKFDNIYDLETGEDIAKGYWLDMKDAEVIGNIYENKELLEGVE